MNKAIVLIPLMYLGLSANSAQGEERCKDLLLNFSEEQDISGSNSKLSGNRKISALIPCESDALTGFGPRPTILHFIETDGNKLCVSQRTCGNVQSWRGYFAVGVGWSEFTHLRDFWFLSKLSRIDADWNGFQMVATFALAAGQLERDCGKMTPVSCVESDRGLKNDDLSWK